MEYMNINGMLGSAVSKLLNKALAKPLGFRPNIELDKIIFQTSNNDNTVKVDFTATMSKENFERLIEEVTK